jgi:hypothetical protein
VIKIFVISILLCKFFFAFSSLSLIEFLWKKSFQLESNKNETSLENKCQNWLCQSTWIIIISSIIAFIFILTLFSFIYRNKLRKSSRKLCQLFGKNSFKEKKEIVDDLENGRLIFKKISIMKFIQMISFVKIFLNKEDFHLYIKDNIKINKLRLKHILNEINMGKENIYLNMKNIFIHYHICNIQIFSSNSKKKNLENENEIYFRYYGYSINVDEYNLIFQLSLNGSLRDVLCSRLLTNDNELKMI